MADKEFDPHKFIDREFEQELFEELLQFKDDARILAICDEGGMGKTQLLQKFQYRCLTVKPRTPVNLIALDDLKPPNPLTLIERIARELTDRFDLQFVNFNQHYMAQASGDFGPIRSSVYLMGSDFREAQNVRIASEMVNIDKADKVTIVSSRVEKLSPEQQEIANRVCIRAFFADVKDIHAKQPIVIILDAFEKCDKELKKWVMEHLFDKYFFDLEKRPTRLALVLAGREIPEFEKKWAVGDVKVVVKSVKQLGKWEKKHVEACLRAHGFNYQPEQLDFFYQMIEMGLPPSQVILAMETIVRRQP